MKDSAYVIAAAAADAAPSDHLRIVIAVLVGALSAVGAGVLHRKDGASLPGAVKRAGVAFTGTAALALSVLFAPQCLPVVVVLLLAALGGTVFGILDRMDGSGVPAAIWRGSTAFVSLSVLGFAFLAVYGFTHSG
ncbi:hypothetical protein [Streptomyces hawaiiensis]|jgi:hypothetical protein|uniref:hypothetical protein n=1 Tax=Streptomyces hawaiiensis TaxID=67305 RepID=UPI0015869CA5|nr:hypothetical protein [Streptomyces hawaiiensis]